MRQPVRAAVVVCTLAAVACGDRTGANETYTVTDSAGVEIVESTAPAWADGTQRIEPEPLLRIGREEDGPYQFAFIAFATLLDDGRIVVAEAAAQELREFDADGLHLRTLGGAGEGPGEFGGLAGVYSLHGDSLVAVDQRLRRTTIFPPSDGAPRTILHAFKGNYTGFGLLADSLLLLYSPGGSYRPDLEPGLQWVPTDILAMSLADGSAHSITNLPDRERLVAGDGNARMPQPLRYAIQAASDNGFYWATPDRYDIGFYDASGTLRRIIRRPVQPRAVEQSMIDAFIETRLERVRSAEGEAGVVRARQSLADDEYGDVVPLFTSALVDRDQRLWVSASEWPSDGRPRRWSVFAPDGYWLGDIDAPDRVHILDSRGDVVLGVWRNEFDVPHLQLHRFVKE